MSLTKQQLIFDEASLATSDQVGAHILGTGDAKITSTDVGGEESLNVNVKNTLSISLAAEKDEDSAHVSGDKGVHILAVRQDTLAASTSATGDYGSIKTNALGEVYVHDTDAKTELVAANASLDAIEASVASIDGKDFATETTLALIEGKDFATETTLALIEGKDFATETTLALIEGKDFATETTLSGIKTATDQLTFDTGRLKVLADIALESDVADDAADTENPLKVGTRAVSGLLSAISASGDKANMISDMYRRVRVSDAPNVGASYGALTVAVTATQVAASALAGRTRIMVQNVGTKDAYVGFTNAVTTANGIKVARGAVLELPFGENLSMYAIASGSSTEFRVIEIG